MDFRKIAVELEYGQMISCLLRWLLFFLRPTGTIVKIRTAQPGKVRQGGHAVTAARIADNQLLRIVFVLFPS